jgi:hypothetical protein
MKHMLKAGITAAALAALMWPAGAAQAQCATSFADPACKAELNCQKGVSLAATAYVAAVQKTLEGFLVDSQGGKITAVPLMQCIGGGNAEKACLATNGVCKSAHFKGAICSGDPDCDGTAGSCDRTKGCNPNGTNNVFQCQVNGAKTKYASAIQTAQTKLTLAVFKACQNPASPVSAANSGLANNTNCPGIGSAATDTDAYNALVSCIEQSVGGDLTTGNLVDTTLAVLQNSTGTGAVEPNNKANKEPRVLLQMQGSNTLQIGNGAGDPTSNNVTAGGSLTPLALAHCVGGNANPSCVNNKDCGTDSVGAAGVCTVNGNVPSGTYAGSRIVTGAPVFTCCASGSDLGKTCSSSADCSGAAPCTVNANCDGPTLTQTGTCAAGTATCLVTHTKNSGNGTTTSGSINLLSGRYETTSPILTDVYVTGVGQDCNTYHACPYCQAKVCQAAGNGTGGNTGGACSASDNSVTQECPPSGGIAASIPNPFTLTTDPKTLLAAPGETNACGAGTAIFCGNCSTTISIGCQTNADCPAGAGTCVFTAAHEQCGFHGDTTVTSISAPGFSSQYSALATGIFCTGQTGVGLVDGSAGLPGPVRAIIPYQFGWVQTVDP